MNFTGTHPKPDPAKFPHGQTPLDGSKIQRCQQIVYEQAQRQNLADATRLLENKLLGSGHVDTQILKVQRTSDVCQSPGHIRATMQKDVFKQ